MSNLSSPRYLSNGSYQHQTLHQRSRADLSEDLRDDYEKALNYIETLKSEQTSLKNTLRLALCDANGNSQEMNSHRQSYHSHDFMSPRTMENRMNELELENQELKTLLGTNSTRINRLQKDQQDYLEKVKQNEALQEEIKELKAELNCLNKEFCTVTNKLLEVEVKNADLLSQSLRHTHQDRQGVEKTSILKYANYIHQLINSADKNHFLYCCFEERFSTSSDFFNLIKSDDQSSLLLKAFKYITDLLINISSQYYTSFPNSRIPQTPQEKSLRYDSYINSNDLSCLTEDLPDRNLIQKAETPRHYDFGSNDDNSVANIVERMLERKSQRENQARNEEVRSPLKNSALKGLSLDFKDQGLFGKSNGPGYSSARYSQDTGDYSASIREKIEERSARSIESTPKRVQFKIDDDEKYIVEEDISEYTGIEDSSQKDGYDDKSEEDSESSENQGLVARYKRELRERCKAIKETEKSENKSKSSRFEIQPIKEASYEQPEESSMSFSERVRMVDNTSASKLKTFLTEGKDSVLSEKSPRGTIKKNDRPSHSRHNQSEVSSVKTGDASESWHINPKLRDYQITTESVKKPALKLRDKSSSLTRESNNTRFTPVVSPRVKSPKSSLTYQQLNAARKSRASIEEGSTSKLLKRQTKQNTSTSTDRSKGTEFASYSVSFWKNDAKSKCSPSPSSRIASIKDISKKKKVDSYPKQTYDVIKGEELVKRKL